MFTKPKESLEAVEYKKYIGIAPVKVIAVNPNKEELSKIYKSTVAEDPVYLSSIDNPDGSKTNQVRIDVFVKVDMPKDKTPIDLISRVTFFLRDSKMTNRDHTKVQVIDKYGRIAWPTMEEAAGHIIPNYTNGPANIDKDYKPLHMGEAELVDFVRTFLCIDDIDIYDSATKSFKTNDNPESCEGTLDEVSKYFTGDVTELRSAFSLMPNNKIKVMFGVRESNNNLYQTIFTRCFMRNSASSTAKMAKAIEEAMKASSAVTFQVCDLKEYSVQPTEFEDPLASKGGSDTVDAFFAGSSSME